MFVLLSLENKAKISNSLKLFISFSFLFHQFLVHVYTILDLSYVDDTTLTAESEEELESLLMRVKEESEKAGLKFNVKKIKILASGPIISWQIEGETMKTVTDFIFGGSKINGW